MSWFLLNQSPDQTLPPALQHCIMQPWLACLRLSYATKGSLQHIAHWQQCSLQIGKATAFQAGSSWNFGILACLHGDAHNMDHLMQSPSDEGAALLVSRRLRCAASSALPGVWLRRALLASTSASALVMPGRYSCHPHAHAQLGCPHAGSMHAACMCRTWQPCTIESGNIRMAFAA